MDPGPVVLDISSDEESGSEPKRSGQESGFDPKGSDYDWLKDFFDSDDDQTGTDGDSDEVVVVGEYKPKQKSKNSIPAVRDMDDDCVLLEGDPDKPAAAAEDDDTSSSDEVMVIGEKGQVACRDYPHSRHACATFPFKTTPHEKHCDLCHCYVCDSPAPCVHWSTGISNVDHCHATDNEETWKILRRNFKLGKNAPLTASKIPDPSLSLAPPQVNQVLPLNIIRLTPISRPTNQVSKPAASHGISPTNFPVPTMVSQGKSQNSGLTLSRTRFQPRLMPGPLLGSGTNISRGKVHHIGIPGRRVVTSRPLFKRPGSVGGSLQVNQFTYNSPSYSSSDSSSPAPTSVPNDLNDILNTIGWDDNNFSTHQSSFQPSLVSPVLSTPPSQPLIFSQHSPPVSHDQNICQNVNQGQYDNQSIYSFGYGNENQNSSQNIFQQEIHSSVGTDVGNIGYNFNNWGNNGCQSDQQFQSELSLLQSTLESPQEPSVKESSSLFDMRSTNFSSVDDLGFDNWHLENQSVPAVSDTSMAPQLNAFSPDPAPVDAGMLLFDFETSWNGLTRA
ncbi:hypothetical protein UlMin_031774 [Ulmus minor]